MNRVSTAGLLVVCAVIVAGCSSMVAGPRQTTQQPLPGAHGWLLCITTDKPLYGPAEVIHGRVAVLDAVTLAPCTSHLFLRVEFRNPHGDVLESMIAQSAEGVVGFTFACKQTTACGNCLLCAESLAEPSAPASRHILISEEQLPTLGIDLHFAHTCWMPGESASARLHVHHSDGSPASEVAVTAVASLSGHELLRVAPLLDGNGNATITVPIPVDAHEDGTLAISIDDHGTLIQTSRPIHVNGALTRVEFSPESGALIAGLVNHLYLQAWLAGDEPLDFSGFIADRSGTRIATVASAQEGRASCTFVPEHGQEYQLHITRPAGISTSFALPTIVASGLVLHACDEHIQADARARFDVTSTSAQHCQLSVHRRGALVAQRMLTCPASQPLHVDLELATDAHGVLVATVSDDHGAPLAERLIFREPARHLQVEIIPDAATHGRGESAALTIRVHDDNGHPAAALVSVAVVDAGSFAALDQRERPPRLPAMALLETEVDHIADGSGYLTGTPAGNEALDLLLGCQNWRRFLNQDAPELELANGLQTNIRRILLGKQPLPNWPQVLHAVDGQPYPALSSRHHGDDAIETPVARPRSHQNNSADTHLDENLAWLQRAQCADGSWAASTVPLSDHSAHVALAGTRWIGMDGRRAATALAILDYLSAGYDHMMPTHYQRVIIDGLAWLAAQAPDGAFSTDSSIQGVVTCCLCEDYGLTCDPAKKPLCMKAVAVLISQQVHWNGQALGWPANAADAPVCDADASVWAEMALKSAMASELPIGEALQGGTVYLAAAWTHANPQMASDPLAEYSTFPARWDPRSGECRQPNLPAQGLVMAILLGHHAHDTMAETLASHAYRLYFPGINPPTVLESYFTTFGMFQLERWQAWHHAYTPYMESLRSKDGEQVFGSWNPQDFGDFAHTAGRTITTALACLSLEFYYRYSMVAGLYQDHFMSGTSFIHHAEASSADYATTLLWEAALQTDATTGAVTVHYDTSSHLADFRVLADAVDAQGALGSGDLLMPCSADLAIEANVPTHLRLSDRLILPVAVHDHARTGHTFVTLGLTNQAPARVLLYQGVARHLFTVNAATLGTMPVTLHAQVGDRHDDMSHTINVDDAGFPWSATAAGVIRSSSSGRFDVPVVSMLGFVHAVLTLYPSQQAQITSALDAMLIQPHGCFEQVSATCYPLAMIERLFRQRPLLTAERSRIDALLRDGYRQLAAYACPHGGFSWWGKDPGHPALTAFGLMQFHDLTGIIPVDVAMIDRARTWLLGQRTVKGVFILANDQPSWGRACANAYITWALLESSLQPADLAGDLEPALDAVSAESVSSSNAYVVALAANALLIAGRKAAAETALGRLHQDGTGAIVGSDSSLLSGPGEETTIQATALAVMAWLRCGKSCDARSDAGADYLFGRCHNGSFGSTQATVLALRALTAYYHDRPEPIGEQADVSVLIDGKAIPTLVHVDADSNEAINVDLGSAVAHGAHRIEMTCGTNRRLPWSLAVNGTAATLEGTTSTATFSTTLVPNSSFGSALDVTVAWNITDPYGIPNAVATISLPAGIHAQRQALDDLVRSGRIAAWEMHGNDVTIYWLNLSIGTGTLTLPCQAVLAGHFSGMASSLRPYYDQHVVTWAEPLAIDIAPPPGWK